MVSALCLSLCGCEETHEAYVSSNPNIRDNTPVCLVPEPSGTITYGNELVHIDASNSAEGYLMIQYLGDMDSSKLQITGPDYMTYTYDLHNKEIETFPLSAGEGEYEIAMYEQIEGNMYSTIFDDTYEFAISNTLGAFLYPNQYVKFDANTKSVPLAQELAAPAHDDLEVINYVYNYLITNITYDTDKAQTVESGYIPDINHILDIKTGICLDYSAVMTSMLRSQRIPCRMEVGYAGSAYHAWISAYVKEIGWINGMVEFDGINWSIMDPTVAANAGEEKLKSFIGEGNNYLTKFIY